MSRITASNPVPWRKRPAKRIGLIDADGILYAAALEGQTVCDGEPLQVLDDSAIRRRALERIEEQAALLGDCPQVFLCLSDRRNFRKDVLPTYKDNRKKAVRPIALDELRRSLTDDPAGYSVFLIKNLEADDVCGIMATSFQDDGYETCIVSPDKDMATIPGMWVTPSGIFSEITEERADWWHMFQTLTGDVVDNYKGCPGIGAVKAQKFLDAGVDCGVPLWEIVVDTFVSKGLTEADALVQARVSRILRKEDWDSEKKEVKLWVPN